MCPSAGSRPDPGLRVPPDHPIFLDSSRCQASTPTKQRGRLPSRHPRPAGRDDLPRPHFKSRIGTGFVTRQDHRRDAVPGLMSRQLVASTQHDSLLWTGPYLFATRPPAPFCYKGRMHPSDDGSPAGGGVPSSPRSRTFGPGNFHVANDQTREPSRLARAAHARPTAPDGWPWPCRPQRPARASRISTPSDHAVQPDRQQYPSRRAPRFSSTPPGSSTTPPGTSRPPPGERCCGRILLHEPAGAGLRPVPDGIHHPDPAQ